MLAPLLPLYLFIGIIVVGIAVFLLRSLVEWQSNNQAAVVELPAKLVTKCAGAGASDDYLYTSYYAIFDVSDQTQLVFKVTRQIYGQLIEGERGLLIYQGTWFVAFERM